MTGSSSGAGDLFYLQDSRGLVGRNLSWWAAGGNGYVTGLQRAEVYTREEALRMHRSRMTDVPWLKSYVDSRSFLAVDFQYAKRDQSPSVEDSSDDVLFYVQAGGVFAGNDMLWRVDGGFPSNDLSCARVYSKAEAIESVCLNGDNVAWPKLYIDSLTRLVADCRLVDLAESSAAAGIQVDLPGKERKETCRCHGCGRFMSLPQFWSGECSSCGADSRP